MECHKCNADNREGRRFCRSCGAGLPVACGACGFSNDADDTFCGGCGQSMAPAAAQRPPAPAQVPASSRASDHDQTQAAASSIDTTQGARRQLTVMFCDLVGSTALSERLDPEEMGALLTEYRKVCKKVIAQFGGFIGNFMGDGLLIYFGYPQAQEDDPQRAIRASLSLIAAVKELKVDAADASIRLQLRVGISTGLVVTGQIGTGGLHEKMAIVGDTPNVAARLQSLAEPDTVLIAERTFRLVEGFFLCDRLEGQDIKGLSEPIDVYRVRQSTAARSRFEATMDRGLTPLAGRSEELNLLENRWALAKEGEGQVVLISGEPGVGKSRVLQSLQSLVTKDGGAVLTLVCSNYRNDTPFHPIIDYFERTLDAGIDSKAEDVLDKLDAFLKNLDLGTDSNAALLASMLSLPTAARYATTQQTLEDQKRQILRVLVAVAEAMSAQAPLLIIVEDLQWADHSTREFLALAVEEVRIKPILLVSAYRSDFDPVWKLDRNVTSLRLRHLSRSESIALMCGVTGGRQMPPEVRDHILNKTDGVPLFIEELTKLVLEMDLMVLKDDAFVLTGPFSATAIPDSLQDSLMARLDHLGSAKEAAQLASVLGRTFGHALLTAISPTHESALEEDLARLVNSELLYRRGLAPEVVFEFKHALVKDAAYQGLLRSKRIELHMEIAQIIEQQFAQMADRNPELLAYHYREAGEVEKAIPFSLAAGDQAAGRYASAEATAHYQSTLDMARTVADPAISARLQIKAILKLANVAIGRDQLERNLGNLEQARALAEEIDYQVRLCQILYWIGRTHYVMGRFNDAADFARQALDLAETLGEDDSIRTGPVNLLARVHCLTGEPVAAINYAARSVQQMNGLGDSLEEASVSGVLAFAHAQHGQFTQALAAADHGVALAEEVGHLPTTAACLMFRGVVNGWFGKLDNAERDFENALFVCQKSGDVFRKYLTLGWQGEARLIAGNIQAARRSLEECLALGKTLGTFFHRGAFEAFLAKAMLEQGDIDAAWETSQTAVETATHSSETWPLSIAQRTVAEVQLALGTPDLALAEASVSAAIDIQQQRQCGCDLAWSHLVRGHVSEALDAPAQAQEAFDIANAMFNDLGIARGVTLTRAAQSGLLAKKEA